MVIIYTFFTTYSILFSGVLESFIRVFGNGLLDTSDTLAQQIISAQLRQIKCTKVGFQKRKMVSLALEHTSTCA